MSKGSSGDESAQEGGGGESGITPPPNSNYKDSGGEDTVYVNLGVVFDRHWEALCKDLKRVQVAAQAGNSSAFESNGVIFAVAPSGFRMWKGGPLVPFVLEHQGIKLGIGEEQRPTRNRPNVVVQIGSLSLMQWDGLECVWPIVHELLDRLGADFLWDKVSRVDMCSDFPEVSVREFHERIKNEQLITRLTRDNVNRLHRRVNQIVYGTRSAQIRMYDKLLESLRDPRKLATLVQHRWGGMPKAATRVEVEMHRLFLARRGISNVSDYMEHRASIGKYLTTEWFRFADRPVDRTNTTRCEIDPLWKRVIAAFEGWTGKGGELPAVIKSTECDASMLAKQIAGCVGTLVVIETDGRVMSDSEFIEHAKKRLHDILSATDIQKLHQQKLERWFAEGPSANIGDWKAHLGGERDDAA